MAVPRVLHRHARVLLALVAAAPVVASAVTPAAAGDATTTTIEEAPPELLDGVYVERAEVTTPGAPARTLSANQATAFMQAWLFYSVFGNPPNEEPPPDVPVSRIDVIATGFPPSKPMVVFFATRGTADESWVGMPAQDLGWGSVPEERWVRAPERTLAGFRGELDPVRTDPPLATTTTGPDGEAAGSGGDSDDGFPWAIAIGAAAVVAIVLAGVGLAQRARTRDAKSR